MVSSEQERSGIELELEPEVHSVGEARRAVIEFAQAVGARDSDVGLAVSEAVGNAVVHAFRGRDPGTITVVARALDSRLIVVVADDGRGMSPHLESPGLGFGISLIGKVTRDVHFESSDKGTKVTMDFPAEAA